MRLKLRFYTSVNGTYACAGTAIDARAFVDYIYIALTDAGNGAFVNARTASDAGIGNFVSHFAFLLG